MKSLLLYIFLFLLLWVNSQSQDKLYSLLDDPWSQPVDMTVDVIHIKLNLDIEPYKQFIKGTESVKFRTLRTQIDSLVFQASEIDFKTVTLNDENLEFTSRGSETIIYFKSKLEYQKEYELRINFEGNPTEGLFFSGWNDKTNRHRKQIWAHSGQGWMPFINQKHDLLTTEIIVKFDSKYKVFSNGERVEEKINADGTTTWHYKMEKPHVIYLVCLVIGDYDYKKTQSESGVPLELWYYPDLADNFAIGYYKSESMIDFFEREIGVKYPWNVYRQAPLVNYMYGGMETTTATVYGDFMYLPARAWWMRNYVNVNAHELNHQWFGNLVSHLNNRHTWLTESFATYYGKLFEKNLYGEDYYQWERDKELTRTFNAAKINNNPVSHSQAGTDRWYPKGSLVLDMMRDVLGDTLFRKAIQYYTEKNSHQVTETYDLLKAIRESTGVAMDWFFDQWILRGGEPHFKVSYIDFSQNGKRIIGVNVEQIHQVDNLIKYFRIPANVDIYFKDGSIESHKEWIEGQKSRIEIPLNTKSPVDFVVFDPNRKIIKKLTFERTFDELISQAEKSRNMIDRYDALLELRKFPEEKKRDILGKIFTHESFHLNKAEIVKQLCNDKDSYQLIRTAISDKDALVRRAVVENIKIIPKELKDNYSVMLKDSCYMNLELALRNLSASFPDDDFLSITKNEIGWRGKNIRIAWLEIILNKENNKKYLNELIDYSSLSFEFETRINALTALQRLNIINDEIVKNAVDSYLHWNFKLRNGGYDFLKYMYSQTKGKRIIDNALENINFTEKQKGAVENLKSRLTQQ